jgi:hypothetical protein
LSSRDNLYLGAPLSEQCRIDRTITVADGRFAPGHLGELTQLIPFEMVDEALAETRAVQSRIRDLPSRVVACLLLAACLFEDVGYPGVWRKLTAGLTGIPVAAPTAGALSQARRRVGAGPVRFLFDLLRGPAAAGAAGGVRWHGLLVTAIDGTMMTAADSAANLARLAKHGGHNGGSGYPLIRVLVLVACGTRTIIDAVFGPTTRGETTYTQRLLRSLRAGMILLADRNFGAQGLLADIAATGADVLVRLKNGRKIPILARYPDGSYLSMLGALRVRIVECEITISTTAGRHTGIYRLATTLCRTPAGVDQEVYALLVVYQLLRTAMADATSTQPDTDPDRASFSIAWQTARDQLIQAAGVIADTVIDLVGTIGRHILANLMPTRRLRVCPRIVKRAISKYQARGPNIDRTSYKATTNINILAPPDPLTTAPAA